MALDPITGKPEYPTRDQAAEAFAVREYFVSVIDRPTSRDAWMAEVAEKSELKQALEGVAWRRSATCSRTDVSEQIMLTRFFEPAADHSSMLLWMRSLGYAPATRLQQYAYVTARPGLLKAYDKVTTLGEYLEGDKGKRLYATFQLYPDHHDNGGFRATIDDCVEYDPRRQYLFIREVASR